jgi:AcrR family transcriptional regulator
LVTEPVKTPRAYRSPLRDERARENRRRILEAAHRLFLADGYARTPVTAIARAAAVNDDLVCHLFKSKRGLLTEVLNFATTGEVDSPVVLDQEGPRAVQLEQDQRRQIAMSAEDVARRVSRVRPVDDVMRSAAAVDLEIARMRERLHRTRSENMTALARWIAATERALPSRRHRGIDAARQSADALLPPRPPDRAAPGRCERRRGACPSGLDRRRRSACGHLGHAGAAQEDRTALVAAAPPLSQASLDSALSTARWNVG